MHWVLSAAAVALYFVIAPNSAMAGPRYSDPGVTILIFDTGAGRAIGTLGGSRNSTDPNERISCTVTRGEIVGASGAKVRSTSVSCSARDTSLRTVTCTTRSEAMANALNGLANDGLIEFQFDANAQCTDILVYESTSLERKRT